MLTTIISSSILVIHCMLLLILLLNIATFVRLQPARRLFNAPMVSILVPARNEEQCIEECIRSLLAQDYEPLEILVLDDQSSDATALIVEKIMHGLTSDQQGRLRLLYGKALPDGWIGKNFACQQLAEHAQGDYLLFTDADTVHAPGMTTAVIACMRKLNLQLLSAQPEHILGSLGECLIVPLLNFTLLTLLPVVLIPLLPQPSLATGNGQLLCFQRSVYTAIGGHAAVKGRILEDVLLARATKVAGYRSAFVDAFELVRCRMYHSFSEVWAGFSKNLFAFYNYSLLFALFALILNVVLFIVPFVLILAALFVVFPPILVVLACTSYTIAVCMRFLLTLRFIRMQRLLMLALSLLHPLSIALECLILLNAIRWHYRRTGTVWKGRRYPGNS